MFVFPTVTRVEVIGKSDDPEEINRRQLVLHELKDVRVDLQDDGKTMKIFFEK